LHITRYSAAYAKFERRTKLVITKLQCNTALIESSWGVSAVCVEQKHSRQRMHGPWAIRPL